MENKKNIEKEDKTVKVSESELDTLVEELDNMLANFAKHQIEKVC